MGCIVGLVNPVMSVSCLAAEFEWHCSCRLGWPVLLLLFSGWVEAKSTRGRTWIGGEGRWGKNGRMQGERQEGARVACRDSEQGAIAKRPQQLLQADGCIQPGYQCKRKAVWTGRQMK